MKITAKPLKYSGINSFLAVERLDLIQGNAQTCYVQLQDESGSRYVAAAGATVSIVFPRSLTIAASPMNQDVTATCTVVDARDASIYRFDLTVVNIDRIVSEGVKLVIVESGVTKIWPVDFFVHRRSNVPGA